MPDIHELFSNFSVIFNYKMYILVKWTWSRDRECLDEYLVGPEQEVEFPGFGIHGQSTDEQGPNLQIQNI